MTRLKIWQCTESNLLWLHLLLVSKWIVFLTHTQILNSGNHWSIHQSTECLLYLALCWWRYNYISTWHLILAFSTRIVHRRKPIVWHFTCIQYVHRCEPLISVHCNFASGTLQLWCRRIGVLIESEPLPPLLWQHYCTKVTREAKLQYLMSIWLFCLISWLCKYMQVKGRLGKL